MSEFIDNIFSGLNANKVKRLTPLDREAGRRFYDRERVGLFPQVENLLVSVPKILRDMQNEYAMYPRETTIAFVPGINMVFALWKDEDNANHLVGSVSELMCDKLAITAFIGASNYRYTEKHTSNFNNVYFIAHTRLLDRLRRKAREMTAKEYKAIRRAERRGEDPLLAAEEGKEFGYKTNMFPADYLALAARGFIGGENVVDLSYLLKESSPQA